MSEAPFVRLLPLLFGSSTWMGSSRTPAMAWIEGRQCRPTKSHHRRSLGDCWTTLHKSMLASHAASRERTAKLMPARRLIAVAVGEPLRSVSRCGLLSERRPTPFYDGGHGQQPGGRHSSMSNASPAGRVAEGTPEKAYAQANRPAPLF